VNLRRVLTGVHLVGGNGYPAILTEIEAAVVQQRLSEHPKLSRGRPAGRRHALAGLLYCAACGAKLTTGSGTYRCLVGHLGCGKGGIKATDIERYLAREALRHQVDEPRQGVKRSAKKSTAAAVNTSPLLAELRGVERRLGEVSDGLADGTLTVAVAGRAIEKLEDKRRDLTDKLARSLPPVESAPQIRVGDIYTAEEVLEAVGGNPGWDLSHPRLQTGDDFRKRWEARQLTEAEVAIMRDCIEPYIDHATVAPRERRGKEFDPNRVAISWRY